MFWSFLSTLDTKTSVPKRAVPAVVNLHRKPLYFFLPGWWRDQIEKNLGAHLVQPCHSLHTASIIDTPLLLHTCRDEELTTLKKSSLSDISIMRQLLFEFWILSLVCLLVWSIHPTGPVLHPRMICNTSTSSVTKWSLIFSAPKTVAAARQLFLTGPGFETLHHPTKPSNLVLPN